MINITLTNDEFRLIWETIDGSPYQGKFSELVAGLRAKMREALEPKPEETKTDAPADTAMIPSDK